MIGNPTSLRSMIQEALMTRPSVHHFPLSFRGAEGENSSGNDGSGTPLTTENPPAGQEPVGTESDDDGDNDDPKRASFTRAEMEKARREAASYRVRAQEAEKKAQEYERAQMNEVERAKAEAEDAKKEAESAKAEIGRLRIERGIVSAASSARFNDPADAITLIDPSDIIVNDDGTPNQNSLTAAIQKLVKAKPYLLASPGSGDGGAAGGPVSSVEVKAREAAHAASIQQRGGVRISG